MRLLLVEENPSLTSDLKKTLTKRYVVDNCVYGKKAIYLAETIDYDLLIIDLKLPDINGLEVIKTLRQDCLTLPILVISSDQELQTKIASFNLGSDDYLTKPFHHEEFKARVKALLNRHYKTKRNHLFKVRGVCLDNEAETVCYQGESIKLSCKEFALLSFLFVNRGKTLPTSLIYEHLWSGFPKPQSNNSVAVHIKRLRKKIDYRFGIKLIETVHGRGYRVVKDMEAKLKQSL